MLTISLLSFLSAEPLAMGAIQSPPALPPSATAMYFYLGAPEVAVGYRQGVSRFEFEVKGAFNVFELSGLAEGGFKFRLGNTDRYCLSGGVALGLKGSSGNRYFDAANFAYVALRPRLSATVAALFSPTVVGLATLDIPWAVALNVSGYHTTPTVGLGAEIHLGQNISFLIAANGGLDVIREPLGQPQARPAWGMKLGIGYRIF
jgi:hypothetical protein